MQNQEQQNVDYMVEAAPGVVEEILRENLSPKELGLLELSGPTDDADADLHGSKRVIGAEELVATTCVAIAGNASYELLKTVGMLLIAKLGKEKVLQVRKRERDNQAE